VPALLVLYSSFGSQNTVYENATESVEIKRGKIVFSYTKMLRQTLCRLSPPCPFHLPFPSFSDMAEAHSYVAATVHKFQQQAETFCGFGVN
jgi:hypothetical protein